MRSGLARRYRYTGPFETVALGGVDSWTRVAENLFPQLSNATRAEALERWLVYDDEALEAARVRRDRGLAEELAREQRSGGLGVRRAGVSRSRHDDVRSEPRAVHRDRHREPTSHALTANISRSARLRSAAVRA